MLPKSLPVLVVTGMAREARIAAGAGVVVVQAGGNPARLRKLLDERTISSCSAVISFGIAGGLDPAAAPGTVLVASGVIEGEERLLADGPLSERLRGILTEGGIRPVLADLLGVDAAITAPHEKVELHARTGAAGVDMESHVAIRHAARHAVPFAAIRVICDPAGRALPAVAANALRPDGTVDGWGLLRGLVGDPAQLAGLVQLAGDARASFRSLSRCRAVLGDGFGVAGAEG